MASLVLRFQLGALLLALATTGAAAQQRATIRGTVVDGEDGTAVGGATVHLVPGGAVLTEPDGRFAFPPAAPGRYTLTVRAIGYATAERVVDVAADTTLTIVLTRSPVPLDTIPVRTRRIRVRGTVRDAETGEPLIDARVRAVPGDAVDADVAGRFELDDVYSGSFVAVEVRELGYLPLVVTIEAENDTTIDLRLEPDPLARSMIAAAKRRLAVRTAERRSTSLPTIDRPALVTKVDLYVWEILRDQLRRRVGGIQCVIIDERMAPLGVDQLETLAPDRIEHIEIVQYGPRRDALMVRIYTRDFFGRLIGSDDALLPADTVMHAIRTGWCR
jgi:Carboxypeptidase regulatory-like domain